MLHSAQGRTEARNAGFEPRSGAKILLPAAQTLPTLAHRLTEVAAARSDATALLGPDESLSFADLGARLARYARWAIEEGFAPGERAALLMHDRPDRYALWLGLARAGLQVALIDPALRGADLARGLALAEPKLLVIDPALAEAFRAVHAASPMPAEVRWQGPGADLARLDLEATDLSGTALGVDEAAGPASDDPAVSLVGTDAAGRPVRVGASHGRLLAWMEGAGGCPAALRDLVETGATLLRGAGARVGLTPSALS